MTDRPAIMSGPMVRALLREILVGTGRTQARWPAWQQCDPRRLPRNARQIDFADGQCLGTRWEAPTIWQSVKPGDRLWVRESFFAIDGFTRPVEGTCAHLFGYDVPGRDREWVQPGIGRVIEFRCHLNGWGGRGGRRYPSIHMPRWASRLTLLVTATRMERVQEISDADAMAEGVDHANRAGIDIDIDGEAWYGAYRDAFPALWQSLHTKPGTRWEDNPEVCVISFRPVLANIDALEVAG